VAYAGVTHRFPGVIRAPYSASDTTGFPSDASIRELVAVREIVHAFLTADRPQDVFQFALDRVSPLVGAAFASIYTIADDDDVMRLAASYNWPARFRPFLGDMRVRVGLGPSGQAAGERRAIHVPDLFADPSLADWQEVATELGFSALVALPLQTPARVLGAVTFYFAKPGQMAVEERGLLQIVADQMAATAEKASMIDDLRRANGALLESNAQLEQQYVAVMEARRLKDEFLSNISHELRTPLTALLGYAYLLQEEMSGPLTAEQRNTLSHMTSSSERLLELIEDLLELTALRRGEVRVQVELFDPRAALEAALHSTAKERPRSIELRTEIPDGPPRWMRSDRQKVVRILSKLLGNAYKFTSEGEVRATVQVLNDLARFTVSDTGIGIPLTAHQLVFDEFRQVDGSTTRQYGGSGLGLALSRQLARLLGGDIQLESAPKEGSSFVVEIPLEFSHDLQPAVALPG
jgi:signal transduction histidine kinase